MASTTEHRAGGADGVEPEAAEAGVVAVPHPRDATDAAAAALQANSVPAPRSAVDPPLRDRRRPRRAGMRWGWIVVGVIVVVLLAVYATEHRTMTVQGSVTLHDAWGTLRVGGSCAGAGAYSWLKPGAPVTISDANGTIVATTTLAGGTPHISGGSNYGDYADNCVFPFTVNDVPATGDLYRVGVDSAHGVTLTADELRTNGATIFLG